MGWLGRRRARPGRVPPGWRVYAIGDVHGRDDLLADIHAAIAADLVCDRPRRVVVVHLGDYVDRGPSVPAVLDRLIAAPIDGVDWVCLRGNHEAMMLDFLADPILGAQWLLIGGLATLRDYGVRAALPADHDVPAALRQLRDALAARLPPAHRHFLARLPDRYVCGDYRFCHAGVRPGIPFAEQEQDDLLWIREPFLSHRGPATDGVVVHGHTPTMAPVLKEYRIGIDTGAVYSDRLSCVVLDGDRRRMLETLAQAG